MGCCDPSDVRVGDTVLFTATVKDARGYDGAPCNAPVYDLGALTSLSVAFRFIKPDRENKVQGVGSLIGDGSTGQVSYQGDASLIDQSGTWCFEINITSDEDTFTTESYAFKAHDVIGA